jgi:hypothetical protein
VIFTESNLAPKKFLKSRYRGGSMKREVLTVMENGALELKQTLLK